MYQTTHAHASLNATTQRSYDIAAHAPMVGGTLRAAAAEAAKGGERYIKIKQKCPI